MFTDFKIGISFQNNLKLHIKIRN